MEGIDVIRGSAGSSLLCYLLGITNFDPIKENIVLSRFIINIDTICLI